MLDSHVSAIVSDEPWQEIATRAQLPCSEEDYFGSLGATPMALDSRRSYRRIRVCGRIAVRRGKETLAAYTIDVSPAGIGFYSPVQLYPKERVSVSFEDFGTLELQISRCRRVRQQCYSCGGTFIQGNMGPSAYRELLRYLKV